MKSTIPTFYSNRFFFLLFFLSVSFTYAQDWEQIGTNVPGAAENDSMGFSVSFNNEGTIYASTSKGSDTNGQDSGKTQVFQNENENWVQIGQDILGESAGNLLGFSLDLNNDGTVVAVGAPGDHSNLDYPGTVKVFQYASGSWTQLGQTIQGDNAEDQMGHSVSLNGDGTILAVGANFHDGGFEKTGQVKIFQLESNTWNLMGEAILGSNPSDILGTSVTLNEQGNRVATGGTNGSISNTSKGHVQVFEFMNGDWTLIGSPLYGKHSNEAFGISIGLNNQGDTMVIGAALNDDLYTDAGRSSIYKYNGSDWTQIGNDIYGTQESNISGLSADINGTGDMVIIGAPGNTDVGFFAGHTRIFQNDADEWVQLGNTIHAESPEDTSGYSVSINNIGNRIITGSPSGSVNDLRSGYCRVFEINLPLSIDTEALYKGQVVLTPNPALNYVELISDIHIDGMKIYDTSGRIVIKQDINNTHKIIDVSHLTTGVYFVHLNAKTKRIVKKITVQ